MDVKKQVGPEPLADLEHPVEEEKAEVAFQSPENNAAGVKRRDLFEKQASSSIERMANDVFG